MDIDPLLMAGFRDFVLGTFFQGKLDTGGFFQFIGELFCIVFGLGIIIENRGAARDPAMQSIHRGIRHHR